MRNMKLLHELVKFPRFHFIRVIGLFYSVNIKTRLHLCVFSVLVTLEDNGHAIFKF